MNKLLSEESKTPSMNDSESSSEATAEGLRVLFCARKIKRGGGRCCPNWQSVADTLASGLVTTVDLNPVSPLR